jgi:hypothetical protein
MRAKAWKKRAAAAIGHSRILLTVAITVDKIMTLPAQLCAPLCWQAYLRSSPVLVAATVKESLQCESTMMVSTYLTTHANTGHKAWIKPNCCIVKTRLSAVCKDSHGACAHPICL